MVSTAVSHTSGSARRSKAVPVSAWMPSGKRFSSSQAPMA